MIQRTNILPVGKLGLVVVQPEAEVQVLWNMRWYAVKDNPSKSGAAAVYSWMGPLVPGKPRTLAPPMEIYFGDAPSDGRVVELLESKDGFLCVLKRPVSEDRTDLGFVWSSQEMWFR